MSCSIKFKVSIGLDSLGSLVLNIADCTKGLMMYRLVIFHALLILFWPLSTHAFHRDGQINENFNYENLEVNKKGYLSGYIVNTTEFKYERVRLEIFGRHAGDSSFDWSQIIYLGELKPHDKQPIMEYVGIKHKDTFELVWKILSADLDKSEIKITKMASDNEGFVHTDEYPLSVKVQGRGRGISKAFTLNKGLNVFSFRHQGPRYFAVELIDKNGEHADLIANDIGVFSGSLGVSIEKTDKYYLNITARPDAKWNVDIQIPALEKKPAATEDVRLNIQEDDNGVIHITE